jgi:hypothetical protein
MHALRRTSTLDERGSVVQTADEGRERSHTCDFECGVESKHQRDMTRRQTARHAGRRAFDPKAGVTRDIWTQVLRRPAFGSVDDWLRAQKRGWGQVFLLRASRMARLSSGSRVREICEVV